MLRRRLLFVGFTFSALLVLLLIPTVPCKAKKIHDCYPSSCGNIRNISNPFRLKGDPRKCGHHKYELSCDYNRTVLHLYSGKYYVEEINYDNFTIRVVDAGVEKDNCSSFPHYSLSDYYNFSHRDPYRIGWNAVLNTPITFIYCAAPVINSTRYADTALCNKNASYSNSSLSSSFQTPASYAVVGDMRVSDVEDSCSIGVMGWASSRGPKIMDNTSFSDIHNALAYGFELLWFRIYCGDCDGDCYLDDGNIVTCGWKLTFTSILLLIGEICGYSLYYLAWGVIGLHLAARIVCAIPCMSVFLIYKWRRRHLSMFDDVECFLQSHNNLMPIRYSYSDIKKMTKSFKDKLGEGGFGCVFKGKLRSGRLVAVKMLSNSKAKGQDFINEVATIGRIHHVNVVQLIGFCAERSKRALVYDFMPNGSLEKYIFPQEEGNSSLSFEKMSEISLGVARGIEYLHRGCDMQILHFDIKPHNILLDENFTPKVSDFGLAKLYSTDNSIVSMTAARGTIGYMAPELFYKNIGGISFKADVYSFGMLLMEMAGRRKNLNAHAEHSSQIHFPSWVYDQFSEGKDIDMGVATEEDRRILKKMIIVALWCIQMKPNNRPSMNKVVEMLEGEVELLQMPPKPFFSPQEIPAEDRGINTNLTESSIQSGNSLDYISLDVNAN